MKVALNMPTEGKSKSRSRLQEQGRISFMLELSDREILSRLTDTEDSTVECKTSADYRDCLKTAVGFSNSLPVGDPGIIFVGLGNDGTVQDHLNLESLQKDVSRELGKIYPPIYTQMKVMRNEGGKEFLVVIVRGNENRPHFAGPSYIRDGTQTKEASGEQFTRLLAERNSKTREILKSRGKDVTVWMPGISKSRHPATGSKGTQRVVDRNQFYVTLQSGGVSTRTAFLLSEVEIAYDFLSDCLEIRFNW